jgi:putative transposase
MRPSLSDPNDFQKAGFQKVVGGFLFQPGLPPESVLTAETIIGIFCRHGGLFGEKHIDNTAVALQAFLGQVLRDGKEASSQPLSASSASA